ncbi:hypothetical protein VNO77_41410 [Canavalia gladiata]|uniref:Uncharacterized protein n=1 Tax=Canavalia gladiata TaxID=3824 RepID=A0AAN9PRL5_CANGL
MGIFISDVVVTHFIEAMQGRYLVHPVSLSKTEVVSSFLLWPQIRGRTTARVSLIFSTVVPSFRTGRRQKSTHLSCAAVISFLSKTPLRTTMARIGRLSTTRLHDSTCMTSKNRVPLLLCCQSLGCSGSCDHRHDHLTKILIGINISVNPDHLLDYFYLGSS